MGGGNWRDQTDVELTCNPGHLNKFVGKVRRLWRRE